MTHTFPEVKKNFGFGLMRLPMIGEDVDYEQTSAMVDAFLSAGFNYFDTAHPYIQGLSEAAVKRCLSSRHPREAYLLANKLSFGCFQTEEEIRPLFQQQLDACGVEYFDFYLMHAMSAKRHKIYQDLRAYDIAQELKAEGKIRHVGMSFHDSAEVLDRILTEHPEIEVVQLQFNYVDYLDPKIQSRACYEVARKHGKPVMVMEPVKGGALANLPEEAAALFTGGSPASYAIRYCAGFEGIVMVLSGMSSLEQTRDNIATMSDFQPLTAQEHQMIDRVRTIYPGYKKVPCTACRYCVEDCPAGIDIPAIFACLNDLHQNVEGARERYEAQVVKPDACICCGHCESACPQGLRIRELLKKAAAEF